VGVVAAAVRQVLSTYLIVYPDVTIIQSVCGLDAGSAAIDSSQR